MRIYQAHDSKVIGMEGPYFPAEVDILNGHFLRNADRPARLIGLCMSLGKVAKPHYEHHPDVPLTSDGYEWGWQVTAVGDNRLLIPDFGDEDTWDGRSIAIYSPTERNNAQFSEMLELPMSIVNDIAKRHQNR